MVLLLIKNRTIRQVWAKDLRFVNLFKTKIDSSYLGSIGKTEVRPLHFPVWVWYKKIYHQIENNDLPHHKLYNMI